MTTNIANTSKVCISWDRGTSKVSNLNGIPCDIYREREGERILRDEGDVEWDEGKELRKRSCEWWNMRRKLRNGRGNRVLKPCDSAIGTLEPCYCHFPLSFASFLTGSYGSGISLSPDFYNYTHHIFKSFSITVHCDVHC